MGVATVAMLSCCVFLQHAERLQAQRLVLVGSDEWSRGAVSVKDLTARTQSEVPVDQLGQQQ